MYGHTTRMRDFEIILLRGHDQVSRLSIGESRPWRMRRYVCVSRFKFAQSGLVKDRKIGFPKGYQRFGWRVGDRVVSHLVIIRQCVHFRHLSARSVH